jgi:hypothetical protein
LVLPQQPAGHTQGAFGLFDIYRFGEYKVRTDAKGFGYACLSLDHRDGKRTVVITGVPRGLEQKTSVLFVLAIHHEGVKVLVAEPFYRGEGFSRALHGKVQIAQHLGHEASVSFIRAEKQGLEAHNGMVGTLVCSSKLLM